MRTCKPTAAVSRRLPRFSVVFGAARNGFWTVSFYSAALARTALANY
jgi:hypothetical protein